MIFKRTVEEDLIRWKNDPYRKPLVIRGARQTGKTTVVNTFAKNFDVYIPMNLEKSADRAYFERGLSVKQIYDLILLDRNVAPQGTVLIFLDEIQKSPEAVSMLRYFYEELPEIYVIAAGSLMEVKMEKAKVDFPTGRVEFLYMYPMSFEEYLTAAGNVKAVELLNTVPIPDYVQDSLLSLFREYMLVGGMPEAVSRFLEQKSIASVKDVYSGLVSSFLEDVNQYADNKHSADVIRYLIETAPYFASDRITFQNFGNSGYKSNEVGDALRTLERAMLVYLRYPITSDEFPCSPDLKKKPKLQVLDIGMMNYSLGIEAEYVKGTDLNDLYNGKAAEQAVGQELLALSSRKMVKPLFWVREKGSSNADLDFVQADQNRYIPIEVKSGKSGSLKSLHSFLDRSENCDKAVRLYTGKYSVEKAVTPLGQKPYTLINLPLFLASKIPAYYDL